MGITFLQQSTADDGTSTRSLVIANAVTILMALFLKWPLATLLLPYWLQSVVIGYYSRKRMLALEKFSTEGLEINDEAVEPTEETKRRTAHFFMLHYGIFHVIYLVFLWSSFQKLAWYDVAGIAVATTSFVFNHRASFHRNFEADSTGCPNIGTLMFLPYLRILPMHLTIILGGALHFEGAFPLLLFGALKTAADVLMHKVEHRVLRKTTAG